MDEEGVSKLLSTVSSVQDFSDIEQKTAAPQLSVEVVLLWKFLQKHWWSRRKAVKWVFSYDDSQNILVEVHVHFRFVAVRIVSTSL